MSGSNLSGLFRPRSVAVIGASKMPRSLGTAVMRNLLRAEFKGPILPVNPKYDSVLGVLCHPSIAALPLAPDLAVLCSPPETLPDILADLGARGTRAAIIMANNLDGATRDDRPIWQVVREVARRHGVRLLGPASNGIQVPGANLNASWMVSRAHRGNIALVSQSGSLIAGVLEWAEPRGIGFSHVISGGSAGGIDLDVDLGDILDHLSTDIDTRAVLIYLRAIDDSRKFLSAARAIARQKPVIAIKPTHGGTDAAIVLSSGERLPGIDSDAVYDAAIRRAGMLRVHDIDELFDTAATLAWGRRLEGEHLAIISNGMGPSEMAMGTLIEGGGKLAILAEETLERLNAAGVMGGHGGGALNLGRGATSERYGRALSILLEDHAVDAVLVMHSATAVAPDDECARAVIEAAKGSRRYVLASWVGADAASPARKLLSAANIANYVAPEKATRAFLNLVDYRRNQFLLRQIPATPPFDTIPEEMRAHIRAILRGALDEGRMELDEREAADLLHAYGIKVSPVLLASGAEAAVQAAEKLGYPVTVQVSMRPTRLPVALATADAVRDAAMGLVAEFAGLGPGMPAPRLVVRAAAARRPESLALMAGIASDPVFGRIVHLGPGGYRKSITDGGAISLPPLNMSLADEMIARTDIGELMAQSFSGAEIAKLMLQALLVRLSELAIDLPEVTLLQINPLRVDGSGMLAQHFHVVIREHRPGRPHLAIRPYPSELEEELVLRDGTKVLARPVRAEDEPAYERLLSSLSAEDMYSRFCKAGTLPREMIARMIHIDYDREMAFVAIGSGPNGRAEILGVVEGIATPDNREAEYSVLVRSDMKGTRLGRALMDKMIRYCRERGIGEIYGMVLRDNKGMLGLNAKLGFRPDFTEEDDDFMVKMVLKLG